MDIQQLVTSFQQSKDKLKALREKVNTKQKELQVVQSEYQTTVNEARQNKKALSDAISDPELDENPLVKGSR